MKHLIVSFFLLALVVAPALAQQTPQSIEVTAPWARATPPGARTGAVYLTLASKGATADRLVDASTPAAAEAQLHVESNDNGVMRMRPLAAVDLPPGAMPGMSSGAMTKP